ncbi:MAG: lipid-A-disaccharide synthase-related protein [Cyanobacteria bacterium J06635_15]
MHKRVLFISNGHGEDNHSSHIIRSLRELAPEVEVAAIPIVGAGHAYRRIDVPIVGPTKVLPSGGFTYVNRWLLLKDIRAGLLGLSVRQLRAIRQQAPHFDLVHATGDGVGQSCAFWSGLPFISFISCLSSLYEGHLQVDVVLRRVLRSQRCRAIVTKDPATATDLTRQGFPNVITGGIPHMDRLLPTGKDLELQTGVPMLAILPGSRLPEGVRNLELLLHLTVEITKVLNGQVQFRAALVPGVMAAVPALAATLGWHYEAGCLSSPDRSLTVRCYDDAFSDIVIQTDLILGMAGLAVEQAVALGKPVIQIPGEGPQFNYPFAEAQERLLGISAQTIGLGPATAETLKVAAQRIAITLKDQAYLAACLENGRTRWGPPGASYRMAQLILQHLNNEQITTPGKSPISL